MSFMERVNVVLAFMGMGELCFGAYVLATGKVPGGRITEAGEVRRLGVATVLFGLFFLIQAVGYLGARQGWFSSGVRGLLLLLAFAVGILALVRYRPRLRSRAVRDRADR